MGHESVSPVRPYIQVNIGYVPEEAPLAIALRNRDLIVPGEPHPPRIDGYLRKHLGVDEGLMPEAVLKVFYQHLANPRSDNFLAFIEEELHPEIVSRYRVNADDVGLFGFSYGGLFSLYAYSAGSTLIKKYGAGSPGILVEGSKLFDLYKQYAARNGDKTRDAHVHITWSAFELLGPVGLYRTLGIEAARFHDLMLEHPVPGVRVTTDMILNEDHGTGGIQSYKSFMRTCFPAN
ncbi:MAG: alpha/beta hydrolase-fold protein [Sphingobium sp.]